MNALVSLSSIEQVNLEKYWDVVRQLEPEYYLLRLALKQTGVNPLILVRVVRSLSNMAFGTGYGKVVTYMQNKTVTNVEGVETDRVEERVIIEDQLDM